MAHRLIASKRRVDSILKNGLLTGNFNSLAQVQQRYSEFRRFLSQSSVYFSYEPPKFDKVAGSKKGKNGHSAKTKGQETTEKKNIYERTYIAASASLNFSRTKAPNQGFNFNCKPNAVWERKKSSRKTYFEEENEHKKLAFLFLSAFLLVYCWSFWKNNFSAITIQDPKDYLVGSGKAKVDLTEEKSIRVQPYPGASIEFTHKSRLTVKKFDSAENEAPETENLETKVDHKNEAPVVHKKKARK